MYATSEILEETAARPVPRRRARRGARAESPSAVLAPWLRAQSVNVTRHAAALRPFRRDEFGTAASAPTEGHLQAVNELITLLRTDLLKLTGRVTGAAQAATGAASTHNLHRLLRLKERAHEWVRAIEKIWDFYFELFGQRQSRFGDWLLSCDRIALDCYQASFLGLGKAKSLPAPPPFSYMR